MLTDRKEDSRNSAGRGGDAPSCSTIARRWDLHRPDALTEACCMMRPLLARDEFVYTSFFVIAVSYLLREVTHTNTHEQIQIHLQT
jgi:hypothetical protein